MSTQELDSKSRPIPGSRLALFGTALALTVALVAPRSAAAQVAIADIPQFVGTWNLPLDAQGQSFDMVLIIDEGADGNAVGTIGSQMGEDAIDTITLNGESLQLEYEIDAQGMIAPVNILLTPLEEEGQMDAELDFADGQFFMTTTATREE